MSADTDYLDSDRTVGLCDVGNPDYLAAVVIGADGAQHLILAQRSTIGDESVRYDPTCATIAHEQPGPLPLEVVRRLAISGRTHRCGRATRSGAPCRVPVTRRGDACGWHRSEARR